MKNLNARIKKFKLFVFDECFFFRGKTAFCFFTKRKEDGSMFQVLNALENEEAL